MLQSKTGSFLVMASLLLACTANGSAGTFAYSHTIPNPSATGGDHFGATMAQSGNSLLVGAESEEVLSNHYANGGAAYLFDIDTGALQRTFREPSPGYYYGFGRSVSILGTTIVIGTSHSKAYRCDAVTGSIVNLPSPIPPGNKFGGERSVAAFGTGGIVTASSDDSQATNSGRGYFYDATGSMLGPINNPSTVNWSSYGPYAYDAFGTAIVATNTRILISAPSDGNAGVVSLFDATGTLMTTFNNPYPALRDIFGGSLALSDDYVLISDSSGEDYAHLYNHTGTLLHTFANPNPGGGDGFGFAMGISGNDILIGAPQEDLFGTDAGAAYLFDAVSGTLVQTLSSPTPGTNDKFGQSVGIAGDYLAVGAPGVSSYHGEAYAFVIIPEPATATLLGLGLIGMLFLRRRTRAG